MSETIKDKVFKTDHFRFTINNWTDNCLKACREAINDPRCNYLIFGYERAPSTGTPHLQGYIQFPERIRSNTVCKLLGGRASVFGCTKTHLHNRDYCTKDKPIEDVEEFGTIAVRKDRTKRTHDEAFPLIRDDIVNGMSLADIACKYPTEWIRYHSGIKSMSIVLNSRVCVRYFGPFPKYLYDQITIQENWTKAMVVEGETGIYKTQFCLNMFENPLVVRHTDQLKGFRPLEHDAIIFDDVRFIHWPRESQLHIADTEVDSGINVKGSHVVIPAFTKKIFTCNPYHFPFIDNDPAINRRLLIIKLRVY